jgi:hypothetical protein
MNFENIKFWVRDYLLKSWLIIFLYQLLPKLLSISFFNFEVLKQQQTIIYTKANQAMACSP